MTALQVYAFFVLPLLILAMGAGAYWVAVRDNGPEDRH